MSSPPFVSNTPTCLSLMVQTFTDFAVNLTCIDNKGNFVNNLLFRSYRNLGKITNSSEIRMNINETASSYPQCAITLQVSSATSGVLAIISDVNLLPGKCRPILPGMRFKIRFFITSESLFELGRA